MFKNLCLVIVACLFSTAATAQEWVSFGSRAEGSPPEVSVNRNDNQQVSFTVELSGMYVESRNEDGSVYKRLAMPQCRTMGEVGSPEIPVVTKMVAIPECSDIVYNVTMSGVQTFSGYVVYPVSEQQVRGNGDGTFYMEEVFIKDAEVYAQNIFMPAESYAPPEDGYLRSQRYVQLELHPVQYNPVTQTLSVATEMEVTLSFVGATTPVNVPLGIFNNVAKSTMVNFVDQGIKASINDKAFEKSGFQQGNVGYKRITHPSQVNNITADYLIICANVFFPGNKPHAEILRLAEHRSFYNGFDVLILNAEDIISDVVGFSYEGNPSDPNPENKDKFKKEQRIRTCIKAIYETGTAHHTMDGKLGYVLLVGEVEGGYTVNAGMPSSYDHPEAIYSGYPQYKIYPSDYYFSCLTKDTNTGIYDKCADVYIGRFSVPNNLNTTGNNPGLTRLSNLVTKTINYEKDFKPDFKKYVNIAYGGELQGDGHAYYNKWDNYVRKHMPSVNNLYGINAYDDDEEEEIFGNKVVELLNSSVSGVLFDIYAHGGTDRWWGGSPLVWNTLSTVLQNPHKQPFCMSSSCLTGKFDNLSTPRCLAEYMTSYSDSLGFVAMLAGSTLTGGFGVHNGIPGSYHSDLPIAILRNLSFITGEFVLETKVSVNFSEMHKYNLFGDPALNIMAQGYVVKIPTTLPSGLTNISCNITVTGINGILTIPENGTLWLDTNGNITLENNGRIEMKNNSKITTFEGHDPDQFIKVDGGRIMAASNANVMVENVHILTSNSSSKLNFKNVIYVFNSNYSSAHNIDYCTFTNSTITLNGSKPTGINNCTFIDTEICCTGSLTVKPTNQNQISIKNSTFTNSPISHKNHQLGITNCNFFERSDITTLHSIVDINKCSFWKSGFAASVPQNHPALPFTPSVKITNSSFGKTGQFLYDDGGMISSLSYSTAAIILNGINEFEIVGDTIINANAVAPKGIDPGGNMQEAPQGEGIYLNNAGHGNVDKRVISGNEISNCETGLYVYNSKAKVLGNKIYGNYYGARLFNNSQTTFTGFDGVVNNGYGYQTICDNISYELYASKNAFPKPFIYNQIIDEDNGGNSKDDPLLYYDADGRGDVGPGAGLCLGIPYNYWGENFDPVEDLYPPKYFCPNPIWTPPGGKGNSTPDEELYLSAMDDFILENYASAKTTLLNLITTYPQSELAIASLHELFALEQFLSEDYAALHNYYTTFTPADSTLFDVADFLATRCNVADQNWQPAIDWYEDRIANPPSYPDSIFAVIDLGDIHLAMESDTLNLKAGRILRYPNLIPKSRRDYEENKAELLATLPKIDKPQPQHPLAETGKKGVLSQNIPNPAKGSTTVVYDVIKEGAVELRVYNQLGQLLQSLPQGTKREGSYNIEISLVGLPAGMYHYILFVDGEKADAKKLIVN